MIHGRIIIDAERCKGCALCISVCPQHVLQQAAHINRRGYHPAELIETAGYCTGCAVCALICPDAAITVYRNQKSDGRSQTAMHGSDV